MTRIREEEDCRCQSLCKAMWSMWSHTSNV